MSDDAGRIHSMDALRASAMILLIPAHAAGILAANGHGPSWIVALSWSIHVFRTPLFFAMSGFFLAFVIGRRGLRATAGKRAQRVLLPLAVGVVTLVPLVVAASQATSTVISASGHVEQIDPFLPQPSFLWFLWYLLIIDVVAASAYLLAPGMLSRLGHAMSRMIARPLAGIVLLALPTALMLWPQPDWIASPASSNFIPDPAMLAYCALFVGFGVTLCVHRQLVGLVTENAWRWAACAVAAAVPAGVLFTLHGSSAYGSNVEVHGAALLIYAIATWTSVIALIGLANRYIRRPWPALRYLADSSYWIYLSHLAPMVLLAGALGSTALATGPRFALIVIGSLGFSLATYPLLVRHTFVGRVLNGPRPRATSGAARASGRRPASDRPRRRPTLAVESGASRSSLSA
jgi:fucose 4-O-acetylase-like acetyltransferase